VVHRTVSDAPGWSAWKGRSRDSTAAYDYNSPDCPVVHWTVRRVIRGELVALGKRKRRHDYNSPDCPVVHRTVPVSQRSPAQRSAAATVGWAHRTVQCAPDSVRCANCPRRPTVGCAEKEGDRAPDSYSDYPVVHWTVRCTTRQKASLAFQVGLQRLLAALWL
jgi:hypothetical protein